jgi:hypothetical protein
MSVNGKTCHGEFDCLVSSSKGKWISSALKAYQKVRSYAVWHLENIGLCGTLKLLILKAGNVCNPVKRKCNAQTQDGKRQPDQEVLNLQPGDLVEVKSAEEILATLDRNRKCRGLLWMTGMRKFCGKRYRVFKRIERILLESNGELRKMKNTVLLEGVLCDGSEFSRCDRSCFHFWREAWLKRIEE